MKIQKSSDVDDMNQAVEVTVKELKELHSGYTPMQYRIWAEMVYGGVHTSMEEPPTSFAVVVGKLYPKNHKPFHKLHQCCRHTWVY